MARALPSLFTEVISADIVMRPSLDYLVLTMTEGGTMIPNKAPSRPVRGSTRIQIE
jgi:hypothetical protein